MTQTITATYQTAVYKPALNGWRQETVTARLEPISAKRYKVIDVLDITQPSSKRQGFRPSGVMARERGKVKLLSSLSILPA